MILDLLPIYCLSLLRGHISAHRYTVTLYIMPFGKKNLRKFRLTNRKGGYQSRIQSKTTVELETIDAGKLQFLESRVQNIIQLFR